MEKISLLVFIIGFLLFRPYQMQETGMLYSGDDYSYFAHATSLAYGQFPSYEKEDYPKDEGERPMHSIGPGVMALPFVFLFSNIDRLTGSSIVQQRFNDNIPQSWTLYGFVVASIFYLWMGCFFLYRGLRHHFQEHESVLAVFLMVLCQGIPLFAFRRPMFSHIFEFFLISVLIGWMLIPRNQWPRWCEGFGGAVIVGLLTGLLELVRLNDVLMILVWPWILFRNFKKALLAYGIAGGLVLGFYVLPAYLSHSHTYSDIARNKMLSFYSPIFYFQSLWHILTGIDWGLIYTAPFILVALIGLVFLQYPLRSQVLLSLLPLLLNFYVVLCWKTQGGWYGYRYLVPMAAPLLIYPLALVLSRAAKRWGKKNVLILSLIISIFPLLSMLAFEGNAHGLTLTNDTEYFNVSDWGNNTYQLNVWKTLIEQPLVFGIAIFKGGPLYIIYCLKVLIHSPDGLLTRIKVQYPYFSLIVFFKTLFIYFLPFLLLWTTCRKKST